jgi:hypothetical protein
MGVAVSDPGPYKKATADYRIYSGSLGDPIAPKPGDKKIAFSIEGTAAKDLFDAIGPDKRDECTAGSGDRVRHRDKENLSCIRTREGAYSCSFGFDLQTGKSIGGSLC